MLKKLKGKRGLAAVAALVTLFVFSSVMTVIAAAQDASLVNAAIVTDKESYDEGEDVNIALTVSNGNIYDINRVKSKITLPDGLTLKSGELSDGEYTLAAGKSKTDELTAYIEKSAKPGDTTEPSDPSNPDNPQTGGTLCPLWLTLAVLSGGTLAVLGIKKKHSKKILSLFMCAVMSFTLLPSDAFAEEVLPNISGSTSATTDITVNGVKKTISAEVAYNEVKMSNSDEVTVTFDTGDGTPVDPITVKKGEALGRLPQSFGVGKAFMGWFTDTSLTNEFFTDTPVNEDITVFASFIDSVDDFENGVDTTYYVEDCAENHPVTLICDEEITADNLDRYITLFAFTGETPENFVVTSNGENEYTIVPETPYSKGCMYRMTANEGVYFKGLEKTINEYTFKIHKDASNIVEVKDSVKYLDRAKLSETDNEYEYIVSAEYYEENSLAVDDVICIGDGTKNVTEDSLFVKITDTVSDGSAYHIQTVDCDVEDVFDKVDIYFTDAAYNRYLEDGLDTAALEQEVLNSDGVQQLNLVLAAVLAESEAVNEIMEGEPLVTDAATALSDDRMKDFSDYANPKADTLADLSKKLGKSLKVSVQIGEAENRNFTIPDPDAWTAITFTLGYKDTIKNKLKIDATFKITEYLNVSLQGYKQFKFKWFDLPEMEFNYAANIYTQTDIEVKVLVCSVGASNYRNITDEVTRMLGSDEENDTEGLVKDVKDMLNKKGGYIELCRLPFFSTMKPLSLFQLNFDLSFVVKMSFAGGIGSKFSVLDSRQVGAYGNSKDGEFEMYKNKLLEGDRYSFDLTVCGYTGIKMGVSGELTVSFLGLKRLGKVGVEVQVGAYLDIYGYARYHVVKPDHRYSTVYRTLMGGFYLEGGIYLEVNLVAESAVFNVRVDVPLIPECKWPLFSMGDKQLVISLNEMKAPIVFSSNGTWWGEINYNKLPTVTAKTLDITTGKINDNATVSWNKLAMSVSGNGFRTVSGADGWSLRYDQIHSNTGYYYNTSAECTGQIYYLGNTLQFTKTADSNVSTVNTVKIIWYDKSRVNYDDIGKVFNVNFYREVDGVKTLVATREVTAGAYAGRFDTDSLSDSYMYTAEEWVTEDPSLVPVKHDNTEFVFRAKRAQVLVAFSYFDVTNMAWTAEVRAVNIGDTPTMPENYENEYMTVDHWSGLTGMAFGYGKMSQSVGTGINAVNCTDVRDSSIKTGLPTDKALYKVTSGVDYTTFIEIHKQHNSDYYNIAYFYTPAYIRKDMTVTYNFLDMNGNAKTESITVPYGKAPTRVLYATPLGKVLKGYSSDGGKTLYKTWQQFPVVYEDTVYNAVYETQIYTVDIQYYDDVAREYKTYKTLEVEAGETLPQSLFDDAMSKCDWQEGTEYKLYTWGEVNKNGYRIRDFEPGATKIYSDMTLRQGLTRSVTVKLDAGEGRLLFEDKVSAFDYQNYEFDISLWAVKDADGHNTYEPTGWKNNKTGEVYAIGQRVSLDYSTTLTAVYTPTPKIYTVNVTTAHGVLLNGKQEDTFTGGYDDYIAFVEKYNNYKPKAVEEEGCTYEFVGITSIASSDGLTLNISFDKWNRTVHRHTLRLDANGGCLTGIDECTEDYGTKIKLSDMVISVSKTDDLRDYVFGGWKDQDGNVYNADDTVTLKKDTTLTAIWTDGEYKNYTITFILDGTVIKEETYHYGDMLPVFGTPDEANGYIFSGWEWLGATGVLSKQPDTMPASTLTAIGTTAKCYISYELDGKAYGEKTVGKIGETITLADKPKKEYYDVTDWTADGITITDGKFVMPSHDVVFKAVSAPKTYNVNMTVDGKVSTDSPMKAQYLSVVTLPEPPAKSGYSYYWKSDDVDIYEENGEYKFTMPHSNVSVECVYTTAKHNVYYMIDGETEPYYTIEDVAVGREMFSYIDLPTKDGYYFNEVWICLTDIALVNNEGNFKMPDSDVYFWGRFAEDKGEDTITLSLEINIDGNVTTHYTLFVNKGETVTLPDIKHSGYNLSYESDTLTVTDGKVTIPTDDDVWDVALTAKFTKS